jgi:hypothetical protein
MFSHVWYLTKSFQLTTALTIGAGSIVMFAPQLENSTPTHRHQATAGRQVVRVLPVTLPHGRLLCVGGALMRERMSSKSFEPLAPSDAVEVFSTIAEDSCGRAPSSGACRAARDDLAALRRALRWCRT